MSKWIDFSIDERKAMIQGVVEAKNIDEASAEKDWWVTAILYALFQTKAAEYLLFKGGTMVEQVYKDEDVDSDIVQTIKTVSPARTFLEKAFLLCEEYQKKDPRTYRMSRHFYDLEKLSHTDYMDKALNDSNLYYDIVEHRKKFYHVGYVDYDKELPASIMIVPSEELVPKYEVDYNDMRSSFIYGEALEFADLLKFLETLQELFRKVPPKEKKG